MNTELNNLYAELLRDNVDNNGLIVQSDKDGGDTPQRVACWALACKWLDSENGHVPLANYLLSCNPEPGRFMRHVKPPHNNINNFTRDQSEILQIALYEYGYKQQLLDILKRRVKRALFHFNTQDEQVKSKLPDPASLFELSCWLRFYFGWLAAPICNLLDVELITGVLIAKYSKRAAWDSDAKLVPQIVFANKKNPTLLAKLAKYIYAKDAPLVKQRLFKYFGVPPSTYNGVPALGKALYLLYRKQICE